MLTYFVIGIIVQIVIFIERMIRVPEIYQAWWTGWKDWLMFIGLIAINVAIWPVAIVCEIINVILGI